MKCSPNFEFCSFPGLALCGVTLSHDAGEQQRATAPSQPRDHKGKLLILYSTFCALDDLPQLQANKSVLSTIKVD